MGAALSVAGVLTAAGALALLASLARGAVRIPGAGEITPHEHPGARIGLALVGIVLLVLAFVVLFTPRSEPPNPPTADPSSSSSATSSSATSSSATSPSTSATPLPDESPTPSLPPSATTTAEVTPYTVPVNGRAEYSQYRYVEVLKAEVRPASHLITVYFDEKSTDGMTIAAWAACLLGHGDAIHVEPGGTHLDYNQAGVRQAGALDFAWNGPGSYEFSMDCDNWPTISIPT
jgi:hypothetical protein